MADKISTEKKTQRCGKYRNWTYRFKSQPLYLQGWKARIIHMLINEDKKLRVKCEYFRNFRIKCSQEGKQKNAGVIIKMQMWILVEIIDCQLTRLHSSNVILSTPFSKYTS